jgi:hypothetical protein
MIEKKLLAQADLPDDLRPQVERGQSPLPLFITEDRPEPAARTAYHHATFTVALCNALDKTAFGATAAAAFVPIPL